MAFNFPNSPASGSTTTNPANGITYTWNGSYWTGLPVTSSNAVTASIATTASFALTATTASYKSNVEYLTVNRTSGIQFIPSGTDLIFNNVVSQNGITYNNTNGQFTLQAGQTYKITCQLVIGFNAANGQIDFGVCNSSNLLVNSFYITAVGYTYNASNVSTGSTFDLVFVAPTTGNYKMRVTSSDSASNIITNLSYLTITKLN